jgi:predicted amidophosphoribosyltransferase
MTASPQVSPHCSVCGAPVSSDASRCPSCGLSRPAARGGRVLGRSGLWMIAAVLLGLYLITLLIVAAAR